MKKGQEKKTVSAPEIILVGNPNVGKSVLFGKLSGQYVVVSNYPGTTVSYTQGMVYFQGSYHHLVDTPGSGSLLPRSEDEKVTRDVILEKTDAHLVQVIDAKNLRRSLLMTRELLNLERPLSICLNMADEARDAGIEIDVVKLAETMGVKVLETVATTGQGVSSLKKSLGELTPPAVKIKWFSPDLEEILEKLQQKYFAAVKGGRFYLEMLLMGDGSIQEKLPALMPQETLKRLNVEYQALLKSYPGLGQQLQRQLAARVDEIYSALCRKVPQPSGGILKFLDRYTVRPLTGIPLALGVLYLIFLFVGDFGAGVAVGFFENVIFGQYLTPWVTTLLQGILPWQLLVDLFVGRYGLFSMGVSYAVAIVLPIMVTFFLAFGLLEDSGLLPRFTVLADRAFRKVGLTGKAVLPCLLGLGCGTMACLTTRILETKKERLIATLLITLGIPCSAQLGVMLGLAALVSPYAFLVIMLIILSQLLLVGYAASKIIPGRGSAFIIELPPLRVPQLKNVVLKTYHRALWFLEEAVPLFLIGTFLLFILDLSGGLVFLEKLLQPVIQGWLGLPVAATQAFILGFLRRDYGAAGLYRLAQQGLLNHQQIVVSLVVITLFVPCIANFLVIIKERGLKTALILVSFVSVYAIFVGTVLNFILNRIAIF